MRVEEMEGNSAFNGSTIFISQEDDVSTTDLSSNIDFYINLQHAARQPGSLLESILLVNRKNSESYISGIQYVRRRETIAMTPANSQVALKSLVEYFSSVKKRFLFSSA